MENYSLETFGVALLFEFSLYLDWPRRVLAHVKEACQARKVAYEMQALRLELKRSGVEDSVERLEYCVCYDTEDEEFTESEDESE